VNNLYLFCYLSRLEKRWLSFREVQVTAGSSYRDATVFSFISRSNMEKKSQIIFTNEQKNALLKFYEEGMTSTKKEMADRIRQCASTIAISQEQVQVI